MLYRSEADFTGADNSTPKLGIKERAGAGTLIAVSAVNFIRLCNSLNDYEN